MPGDVNMGDEPAAFADHDIGADDAIGADHCVGGNPSCKSRPPSGQLRVGGAAGMTARVCPGASTPTAPNKKPGARPGFELKR